MHEVATPQPGEIRSFVLETIRDVMNIAVDDHVDDAMHLGADGLGVGSLQIRELTVRLNEHYGVDLPNDLEEDGPISLGALVGMVVARAAPAEPADGELVSRETIRGILADATSLPDGTATAFDAELGIDSYSIVLLLHTLEESEGVVLRRHDSEDPDAFTSIDRTHASLNQRGGRRRAPAGTARAE